MSGSWARTDGRRGVPTGRKPHESGKVMHSGHWIFGAGCGGAKKNGRKRSLRPDDGLGLTDGRAALRRQLHLLGVGSTPASPVT